MGAFKNILYTDYVTIVVSSTRNYVKQDIIRRIMARLFDLNVIMVMGITDIDDKIIKRANEVSQTYTLSYLFK